jgi:hypothetical protein
MLSVHSDVNCVSVVSRPGLYSIPLFLEVEDQSVSDAINGGFLRVFLLRKQFRVSNMIYHFIVSCASYRVEASNYFSDVNKKNLFYLKIYFM